MTDFLYTLEFTMEPITSLNALGVCSLHTMTMTQTTSPEHSSVTTQTEIPTHQAIDHKWVLVCTFPLPVRICYDRTNWHILLPESD